MKKIKILGFLQDLDLAEKGVSATLSLLTHHLMALGIVDHIVDTKLPKVLELLILFSSYDINFKKWIYKKDLNIYSRILKTHVAKREISNIKIDQNVCLQIGSEFDLSKIDKLNYIPKFSYHDNNVMALINSTRFINNLDKKVENIFKFEKNVYDKLSGIFTMTEFLRNSFINDFSIAENKVYNVGFGTNIPYNNFDREYDKKTILFVAKDSFEKKGGLVLLEAFKKIKYHVHDAKLILLGQDLKINQNGVEVVGFIDKRIPNNMDKLKSYYRNASIFAMPSYDEAAGNVFIEAMSNKVPCIGADRGSTPEIITENGCGYVVEPGNSEKLADITIYLLNNVSMLKEMGEKGFEAVEDKYNWNAVCSKVVEVINRHI